MPRFYRRTTAARRPPGVGRLRYPFAMRKDPIERLLRGLYSAALYVLVPITLYHLVWRGFRQPAYFQRWPERYAMYRGAAAFRRTLWVHAVSVGEVNAAVPLVKALRRVRADAFCRHVQRTSEQRKLGRSACAFSS